MTAGRHEDCIERFLSVLQQRDGHGVARNALNVHAYIVKLPLVLHNK